MNYEIWNAYGIQGDGYGSRRPPMDPVDETRGQAHPLHSFQCAPTSIVFPDGADEGYGVTQNLRVRSEVEGCPAQVFPVTEDIPQDFPNAQNAHG
jgi:hypothetical protein